MAMIEEDFVARLSAAAARTGNKKDAFIELGGMILSLMRKIEKLEQRPEVKYVGVWRDGEDYLPGMLATYNGSLFHCQRQTTSKPGGDATWQLCVKNGSFK